MEQSNQYYPFRMLFAESTNPQLQDYKYNGKELDRMHGLDMYDYSARYYNSTVPMFTTADPHLENYYSWSPYVYVANNPMKFIDPTGMDWVYRVVDGVHEVYYDRSVRSQDDVNIKYGSDGGVTHLANGSTATISSNGEVVSQYTFFNDASSNNQYGAVVNQNGDLMPDNQIIAGNTFNIFGTSNNSVDAETLHKNRFSTSYLGERNPKDYNGNWSYQYPPQSQAEWAAYAHDLDYDRLNAAGKDDAFFNTSTARADAELATRSLKAIFINNSLADRGRALAVYMMFHPISIYKRPFYEINNATGKSVLNNIQPTLQYSPF